MPETDQEKETTMSYAEAAHIARPTTRKLRRAVFVNRRPVGWWLLAMCGVLLFMILVGGATRLTDSGLSITEWRPVTGAVPPLTTEQWEAELEKYRQIPEYQFVNKGMTVEEFKFIYYWEWGHRLLGRIMGALFAVGFVYFWLRGALDNRRDGCCVKLCHRGVGPRRDVAACCHHFDQIRATFDLPVEHAGEPGRPDVGVGVRPGVGRLLRNVVVDRHGRPDRGGRAASFPRLGL